MDAYFYGHEGLSYEIGDIQFDAQPWWRSIFLLDNACFLLNVRSLLISPGFIISYQVILSPEFYKLDLNQSFNKYKPHLSENAMNFIKYLTGFITAVQA